MSYKKVNRNFQIIGGFIFMIIGLSVYLWVRSYSPYTVTFGWALKKPVYNSILIFAAIFGVGGIVSIIQGLIDSNNSKSLPSVSRVSFCSQCGAKPSPEDTF